MRYWWEKNNKVNWILLVIIVVSVFSLLLAWYLLGKKQLVKRDLSEGSLACGSEFDVKADQLMRWIDCGLYKTTNREYFLIARINDIWLKNGKVLLSIDVGNLGTNRTVELGMLDSSYIWVTEMKEMSLYHTDDNYQILLQRIDENFVSQLSTLKGKIIAFTILKGTDIQDININEIEEPYRESILYSQANNRRCASLLDQGIDFRLVNEECPYFLVHNLWLF